MVNDTADDVDARHLSVRFTTLCDINEAEKGDICNVNDAKVTSKNHNFRINEAAYHVARQQSE